MVYLLLGLVIGVLSRRALVLWSTRNIRKHRLIDKELYDFEQYAKDIIEYLERSTVPLSDYGSRQLVQARWSLMLIEEIRLYRTH